MSRRSSSYVDNVDKLPKALCRRQFGHFFINSPGGQRVGKCVGYAQGDAIPLAPCLRLRLKNPAGEMISPAPLCIAMLRIA